MTIDIDIDLVSDENRDDESQQKELPNVINKEERNDNSISKREMTWKELQANNAGVVKLTAKWKQQRTRLNTPKNMIPTDKPTTLRQSSRTNINVVTCTKNTEPEAETPPKCSTSPHPGARREFLAKKGYLLGNRGAAYAVSQSSGNPNQVNNKPMLEITKPSKRMDLISSKTKVTPTPLTLNIMKPDLVKKEPVPITAVISNTSLSSIKLVKANIKQKKLEAIAKKADLEAEVKKLEFPITDVNTKKMNIAASVAKKYAWETKTKPDTPKPNKTASKAMSFRNAKLRDNSRSVDKLMGMITPDSTETKLEALQEQTQTTVSLIDVPAFRKNPFGVPGTEVLSALKKIHRKPCVNETAIIVSAVSPQSLISLSATKITTRRWSATKQVKPSSQDSGTPFIPLAIEKERTQRSLSPKSGDNVDMRRNRDNRTVQLKNSDELKSSIVSYRRSQASPRPNHYLNENLHLRGGFGKNGVSVFVRKRPIFDYELDRGDFDVLLAEVHKDHDSVVVHVCQMHTDKNQQLVKPMSFPCSAAFDEVCSNEELYQHVARPLVNLAAQGGLATIIMYGQTGSGKIFTMNGIEERICHDLFQNLPARAKVSIQFIELRGKQCCDLLEDGPVKVVDQACGSVRLLNAATVHVTTPMELSRALARGKRRRASAPTDRNGVSSRSHAVCQITVHLNSKHGSLTLIDLAGSERRNDSLYHTQERQKESSEVNASLWALKECIRARASGCEKGAVHIPYSSSNLTRILREPLERVDSQLCVIATVAPNASDTDRTLETLKMLSSFVGDDHFSENTYIGVPSTPLDNLMAPKEWNHKQLIDFLKSKNCIENTFVIPVQVDGRTIMRMNTVQIKMNFFEGKRDADERAVKVFRCVRAESDRVFRLQLKQQMSGPTK